MKIKSEFINLIILAIFLTSCSHIDSSNKIVKISFTPTEVSKWYLENEMRNFYFVPLATQKEFLINYGNKFYFTENEIIVIDLPQKVIFVFNRQGKIKYKVSARGKGPGEYSSMDDALFDEKKMQLEVLDRSSKKILYYNLSGDFLYDKKIDNFNLSGNSFYKSKSMYIFDRVQINRDGMRIALYDEERLSHIKSFLPIPKQILNAHFKYPHVYEDYHDSTYYIPEMDDKIYAVNYNSMSTAFEINYLGKKKIDKSESENLRDVKSYIDYMSSHGYLYGFRNLFINDGYISFRYQYKNHKPISLFYSKSTGKTRLFDELGSTNYPKLRLQGAIIGKDGEYFAVSIDPSMKEFLPDSIRMNLNDNSNPVLLFFKLKDF